MLTLLVLSLVAAGAHAHDCARRHVDNYNLELLFEYLDSDGNKQLDYTEALTPSFAAYTAENIKAIDTDTDGVDSIDPEELKEFLSDDVSNVLFAALDDDHTESLETAEMVLPAEITRVGLWVAKKYREIDADENQQLSLKEAQDFFSKPCATKPEKSEEAKKTHHRGKHGKNSTYYHSFLEVAYHHGKNKDIFDYLDTDDSGALSKMEISVGFTAPFVFQVGPYLDENSDGEYSEEELLTGFDEKLVAAIMKLDKDSSGGVSADELKLPFKIIKQAQTLAADFETIAGEDKEIDKDEAKKALSANATSKAKVDKKPEEDEDEKPASKKDAKKEKASKKEQKKAGKDDSDDEEEDKGSCDKKDDDEDEDDDLVPEAKEDMSSPCTSPKNIEIHIHHDKKKHQLSERAKLAKKIAHEKK